VCWEGVVCGDASVEKVKRYFVRHIIYGEYLRAVEKLGVWMGVVSVRYLIFYTSNKQTYALPLFFLILALQMTNYVGGATKLEGKNTLEVT
jgi:hypothetical protein